MHSNSISNITLFEILHNVWSYEARIFQRLKELYTGMQEVKLVKQQYFRIWNYFSFLCDPSVFYSSVMAFVS